MVALPVEEDGAPAWLSLHTVEALEAVTVRGSSMHGAAAEAGAAPAWLSASTAEALEAIAAAERESESAMHEAAARESAAHRAAAVAAMHGTAPRGSAEHGAAAGAAMHGAGAGESPEAEDRGIRSPGSPSPPAGTGTEEVSELLQTLVALRGEIATRDMRRAQPESNPQPADLE